MNIGLAGWGLRETPIEEQLKLVRSLGLDLLELQIANYPKDCLNVDSSVEKIEEVRQLFVKYGVKLECACTGNDFTGDDPTEEIIKVKKVIDIVSALGIKYLRIFAGFSSDSRVKGDILVSMLNALREVREYADGKNVVLCVETHGGVSGLGNGILQHTSSATTRIDLMQKIVETGVKINYDPANLTAVGCSDIVSFYNKFKKDIVYLHLKDFKDVGLGIKPVACGEGRINWTELKSVLAQYDGPALIEYENAEDVADGMTRSLEFLKDLMK